MQILISNTDYNVVVKLTSNASISGTYTDVNEANISKLEQIVSASNITPINTVKNVETVNPYISVKFGDNQPNIPTKILPLFTNPIVIPKNDTYDQIKNYFNTSDYFVTGTTSSKYKTILNSYIEPAVQSIIETKTGIYDQISVAANKKVTNSSFTRLNKNISVIANKNVGLLDLTNKTLITPDVSPVNRLNKKILIHGTDVYGMILSEGSKIEYILYVGTQYPIKYIDFPDGTTMFMYKRSPDYIGTEGNIVLYNRLVEEPKILSEVFIDRGANNAFEPVKRLKNVDNLNELMKIGLGYYKINTTGVNFKQSQ